MILMDCVKNRHKFHPEKQLVLKKNKLNYSQKWTKSNCCNNYLICIIEMVLLILN